MKRPEKQAYLGNSDKPPFIKIMHWLFQKTNPDQNYRLEVNGVDLHVSLRISGVTKKEAHDFFIRNGFTFTEGAGYFWTNGNIAEAFKNDRFVPYPDWNIYE